MGGQAKKRASYEDLYAIPERAIGEIIDGELVVTPRPSPEHTHASSLLGLEIGSDYVLGRGGDPGGWIILFEREVMFAGRGEPLVPDPAGWKKERFVRPREHNSIDTIPGWICEVLSPGTAKKDRFTKMAMPWRVSATSVFRRGELGSRFPAL